jgi:hypothetical protein
MLGLYHIKIFYFTKTQYVFDILIEMKYKSVFRLIFKLELFFYLNRKCSYDVLF